MSKTVISQTRPVAPYLGGKRNLAKRICTIIDADQHSTYAEPFVGMGGIFLRRTSRPKAEFINDAGRDVYIPPSLQKPKFLVSDDPEVV